MILDMVQNSIQQIPLLLSMQEEELALRKSINNENCDLIYLTLLHMEKYSKYDTNSFYKIISTHSETLNLLKKIYYSKISSTNYTILQKFLLYNKNYIEACMLNINQIYIISTNNENKNEKNENKIKLLKNCGQLLSLNRELSAYKLATDDHIDLIDIQNLLEIKFNSNNYQNNDNYNTSINNINDNNNKTNVNTNSFDESNMDINTHTNIHRSFINLTLTESIYQLLSLGIYNPIECLICDNEIVKITKKFKISEKHLWYIKIQCFCKLQSYNSLYKLITDKKSPIGYKPFAIGCIKYNFPVQETEKYIDRMTELDEKFDLYCSVSLYKKAVDIGIKSKDVIKLQKVLFLCKDLKLSSFIQETIIKM